MTAELAPFNFCVSKMSTWPELAFYALEVLACPVASVLSERVFSTAGGVITDKRSCLSTANVDNVDKLTFIKMNQGGMDATGPVHPLCRIDIYNCLPLKHVFLYSGALLY